MDGLHATGAYLILDIAGYEKMIYDTEFLPFNDITFSTAAIPEPDSLALTALGRLAFILRVRKIRPS
jgi:hypothetical protein